jgi:hypothetical protein
VTAKGITEEMLLLSEQMTEHAGMLNIISFSGCYDQIAIE